MTAISLDRPAPVLGGFTLTYLRIELVRKLRNPRALFFTVAFPVLMFFIIGYQMLDSRSRRCRWPTGECRWPRTSWSRWRCTAR